MSAPHEIMKRSRFLSSCTTSFLRTASYEFHHMVQGSGSPLILVHGGGVWLYTFRHIIEPLSERFRVHAPDMPGFGFTRVLRPVRRMDVATMVEALKEYMDALGIAQASLVGHSWGGGWVLAFALAYSASVEKLVLVDSSGLDVNDIPSWRLIKIPLLGRLLLAAAGRRAARRMLELAFYDSSLVDDAMVTEILLPLRIRENRRLQALLARHLSWKGVQSSLHTLKAPAALIWGKNDRYLPATLAHRFTERICGLRVHIIENCGHSPHEEKPLATARIIKDFLGRQG